LIDEDLTRRSTPVFSDRTGVGIGVRSSDVLGVVRWASIADFQPRKRNSPRNCADREKQ
jgi:hypothetical protein